MNELASYLQACQLMLDIPIDNSLEEQLKKSADTNDLKKCIKFEQDHENNVNFYFFNFYLNKF